MDAEKLYDHYKDTFAQQQEYITKRDKLTIYLLLSVVIFAFLMSNPENLTIVVNSYIKGNFQIEGNVVDFSILNTGIVYLLLWFVLQYYQVCLTIEKQYSYLWQIENRLSDTDYSVTREGQYYALNYPFLKNVANVIYAWGIPVGVCVLGIMRLCQEIKCEYDNARFDAVGLIAISLFSLLYISDRNLCWEYLNKNKQKGIGIWKRMKGFVKIDVER